MVEPHHDLEKVREAAESDRFQMGKSRCLDLLLPYLNDILRCRDFVRRVTCSLQPADFIGTVKLKDGGWDEYGVNLSNEIATEFGLEDARTWYLKLRMIRRGEEELYFLSFHRPEGRLWRVGGALDP